MRTKVTGSFLACLAVLAATFTSAAGALDLRAKIDPVALQLLEDAAAVGFIIGIAKEGRTQVISYGEVEKNSGSLPNSDTLFEIGSVSKVFTGVLLADMVQRGRVVLDDPVQKYLPDLVKAPIAVGAPIGLEHLATHTSGLPRLPDNMKPADPSNPYAGYTVEQMYAFLSGHRLRRAPGQYEYSNYGMALLGHLLSRFEGKSYEQQLIDRICNPLDMADTRITLREDQLGRLALPYSATLQPGKNWDLSTLAGAGGIRSTVRDMLKFVQANLTDDQEPISKALLFSQRRRHAAPAGLAIGLGWHIARDGISRWHNGMTGGYHSWLAVVPSRGVGVVVLANTATPRITKFGEQVTQIALGLEVKAAPSKKSVEVDPALLASYAGIYVMAPQFSLTVTFEAGKLMVQATGQQKIQVFAESETKFYYKVVDAQITFVPAEDGRVNKLVLHQGGRDMEAIRKD